MGTTPQSVTAAIPSVSYTRSEIQILLGTLEDWIQGPSACDDLEILILEHAFQPKP